MAKYGSDDVYVAIDGNNVSADVLEISGIDKEAIVEESHGFGDAWVENLPTGLSKVNDITIKGFYDDTVTIGTHALFNRQGSTASVYISLGGVKAFSATMLIKNYRRLPSRGELHKFEAVLVASGTPTDTT